MYDMSWNVLTTRIKSGNFGQQVNSDIHLQKVEIQMRRLLMSRLIKIFMFAHLIYFSLQFFKYEINKVADRIDLVVRIYPTLTSYLTTRVVNPSRHCRC